MTFTAAQKAARAGALVRRADWCNPLRCDAHGRLEFVIAVHLHGKTYDRSYDSTLDDRNARDWSIAE